MSGWGIITVTCDYLCDQHINYSKHSINWKHSRYYGEYNCTAQGSDRVFPGQGTDCRPKGQSEGEKGDVGTDGKG